MLPCPGSLSEQPEWLMQDLLRLRSLVGTLQRQKDKPEEQSHG